jgi:uncharacterized protein (TIGR00266 family)
MLLMLRLMRRTASSVGFRRLSHWPTSRSQFVGICNTDFLQQSTGIGSHSFSTGATVATSDQFTDLVAKDTHLPSPKHIDFSINSRIEGEESHVAIVDLYPGEVLRAESGAMLFMTEGIVMETKLNGVSSAFTRMLTGQNLFLTDFHYEGDSKGTVGLGTDFPSKILRFTLQDYPNSNLICQKGAYLASNPSVNIEMEFTKSLSAGFFGGQGFVLQKLSGEGDVLLKGGGTVVKKELKEGETLRVTSGSIIAFESTMDYDVQMMPGIKNALFGGEGLFVTTLTGPGSVWLQGMPPDRMIAEIARRVPGPGIGLGIPIGLGGGSGSDGAAVPAGGAEEIAAGAAAGAASEAAGATETVAATDAAIAADRQAAVATSGLSYPNDNIDADSPSALFGDAAPKDLPTTEGGVPVDGDLFAGSSTTDDMGKVPASDEISFSSSSTEPTFTEDEFSTSTQDGESGYGDEFSADEFAPENDIEDGELFSDKSPSGGEENIVSEEEGGSSLFGSLWDFFTGGDGE